jgi:hypothetical protein
MTDNSTIPAPAASTGYWKDGKYHPQPPVKKKRRWVKPAAYTAAAALLFGLGTTAAGTETVEVEKRVEVPVEKIVEVEKEVEVEVTPASCLEALDLSEQAFDYASEAMGYMSEAMTAASTFDVAGVEQSSANLKELNPKISALAPLVNAAKSECRGAGV